jgi:hypothetical protein
VKVKDLIKKFFPGLVRVRNRVYNDIVHARFKNKPIKEVFETIYQENHWNDAESKSGTGSALKQTQDVIHIVEQVIELLKVKSLLDIPCGDFNWMRDVRMNDVVYYGADIVDELIAFNKQHYENEKRKFFVADLTSFALPKTDLIFCRDCLVHLSYNDIRKALANIKSSGIRYLLTTTFTAHSNHDIVTGNWRPLNLQARPFLFPSPMYLFSENCREGDSNTDKSLAVWEVSSIPSI